MRLAIIANPTSGRGRPYRRLVRYLESGAPLPFAVELLVTTAPGDAARLAASLAADCPDLLAVCGGDGTVNEILPALPALACPLGLLPGGTANVLAKELGIRSDPVWALRAYRKWRTTRSDTGVLRASVVRQFLLMAGAGFDAFVAKSLSPAAKARLGIHAYYFATAQAIRNYPFPVFTVWADGVQLDAVSCVVANTHGYGGELALTPDADMTDGILDLLVLGRASRVSYLWLLLNARFGRALSAPWLARRKCRSVKMEGRGSVPLQVDGDPAGTIPAEVEVRPGSVELAVPFGLRYRGRSTAIPVAPSTGVS